MFADDYSTTTKIHAAGSSNYHTFPTTWQVTCPTRSNGSSYYGDQCDSLTGWATHVGGAATITIVASGHADPAIGNVQRFYSGTSINSSCYDDRTVGSIPSSYWIATQMAFPTTTANLQDCFRFEVQNTVNNKYLEVLTSGTWLIVCKDNGSGGATYYQPTKVADGLPVDPTVFGPFWEQWWHVLDNSDGTHTVSLYAGGELYAQDTVTLLARSSGTAGRIQFQQLNGVTTGLITHVSVFNIGSSQLCDNMTIEKTPYTAPYKGTSVTALLEVADISNSMVLGTDFTAEIKINSGSWQALTLTSMGAICKGNVDYTKDVILAVGTLTTAIAKNDLIRLRYKTHDNKLITCNGSSLRITSVYP